MVDDIPRCAADHPFNPPHAAAADRYDIGVILIRNREYLDRHPTDKEGPLKRAVNFFIFIFRGFLDYNR
jgi:hypothetical protein